MTENRKLAEKIFNKIEAIGFKPYDIKYGNGYFVFDSGEDSVIHFRCKGVSKHWLFGMWIWLDTEDEDYPVVQLFSQYDTDIDKFKPSRSDLCVKYKKNDLVKIEEEDDFVYWELKSMLKFMKRHPLIAYAGFCGEYAGYRSDSFLWNFIDHESWLIRKQLKKGIQHAIWVPYTRIKCSIAQRDKCIDKITLYNFEKENPGWTTGTTIEVRVCFTEEATEEQELKWLNRWFKKDKYGKYGCWDYVVALDGLTKVGYEGTYVYTKGE